MKCLVGLPSYCFGEYKTLVIGDAFGIRYRSTKLRNYESITNINVQ